MAKKFFYVCAGLFLLLLSYHLGAAMAVAQISGSAGFIGGDSAGPKLMTADGTLYQQPGGPFTAWIPDAPVPLSAYPGIYGTAIIDWDGSNHVLTNTGRVFERVGNGWIDRGQSPVGPTPSVQSSWGAVKVKGR